MKITVTRLLWPEVNQRRYSVRSLGIRRKGDILPDVLNCYPAWVFGVFDHAFSAMLDVRPWLTSDDKITISIEIHGP